MTAATVRPQLCCSQTSIDLAADDTGPSRDKQHHSSRENQMGWLFTPGSNRRSLIAERTEGWEREHDNGLRITTTCLAHCYRGGCFSGVLWSVWERTFEKDAQPTEQPQRWIQCDLLYFNKRHDGWGYKDMIESMHPYYFSCPKKYLGMVPLEQFGGNAGWREQVIEHHQRATEKRRARRLAKQS